MNPYNLSKRKVTQKAWINPMAAEKIDNSVCGRSLFGEISMTFNVTKLEKSSHAGTHI